MFRVKRKRTHGLQSESGENSNAKAGVSSWSTWKRVNSVVSVLLILTAIAASTNLALRRTGDQNLALRELRSSGRLEQGLDHVQNMMLDTHIKLYTLINTKPFSARSEYVFPLPALFELTRDAPNACGQGAVCLSQLADLNEMLQLLAERNDALVKRATWRLRTAGLGDPETTAIDAYFYSVLAHAVALRMQVGATVGVPASRSSTDARPVSTEFLVSGITAVALLLALIYRNAHVAQKLRVALREADRARSKYQRLFEEHPLPIWLFDDESLTIVTVNRAAQRTFGYSEAELLGMTLRDIRPEDERTRMNELLARRTRARYGVTRSLGVWLYRTKSGQRLSMDVHHLKLDNEGRSTTLSVMVDVTTMTVAQAELFKSKQTLEYVLDHVPHGIAWKDADHHYVWGNEIYARDAGLISRRALIGLTDRELKWGDDPDTVRAEDIRVMAGELTKKHFERAAIAVDGSEVWISETKVPLKDQSGAVIGVLNAYENITKRRTAQVDQRLQGRALEASINGIVISEIRSGRDVVIFANPAFEHITGYGQDDVLNAYCDDLFALNGGAEDWHTVRHALTNNTEANVTLLCTRKNGKRFWNNVLIAPVRDDNGQVTHHVAVMSDVSALVEFQRRLKYQARYDSLTGLPNRTLLDEHLSEAIARASDTGGQVSVLFLDLDRFKEVNDSLGHRVGDALLTRVAKRLQRLVPTDLVARYGGDEFIFVAERSVPDQLVPMLDQLVAAMAEPFYIDVQELYVEASIGVSSYPQDGPDADTLIRNADAAMYLAKEHGRNGYEFYRPELNLAAVERLRLSTRLKRAVNAEALQLAYQPQVDMLTGRVVGAEALLRWHDEELGAVSPTVFIPVAEGTGMIQTLGEWVLRMACRQAKTWQRQGSQPIRVSVNVSPLQLERSDLANIVKAALTDAELPAELLELEVTEGALMRNADDVAQTLLELRSIGIKIAIDDFGTGYSSLSYLKRFCVDRIKIDRAFIREIGADEGYEALTLAVIAIANALKFDVIAEGVEFDVHRSFLIANGCTEGQGHLFSPALPGDLFAKMLLQTPYTVDAPPIDITAPTSARPETRSEGSSKQFRILS